MTHEKWMHMDIAGVMNVKAEVPYLPKGLSGTSSSDYCTFASLSDVAKNRRASQVGKDGDETCFVVRCDFERLRSHHECPHFPRVVIKKKRVVSARYTSTLRQRKCRAPPTVTSSDNRHVIT